MFVDRIAVLRDEGKAITDDSIMLIQAKDINDME
jgi:hypothetical protein